MAHKSKIYTKTGDKGETSLFTGERVSKNDPFIEALGAVDECNSAIGLALSLLPAGNTFDHPKEQLHTIQHALFDVGASLATPRTRATDAKLQKTRFDRDAVETLEQWIDELDAKLPPLRMFILPGGHPSGAAMHLARSICRRCERIVTPLSHTEDVLETVVIYLNRLSDYLFVVSRYINLLAGCPETHWEYHKMDGKL